MAWPATACRLTLPRCWPLLPAVVCNSGGNEEICCSSSSAKCFDADGSGPGLQACCASGSEWPAACTIAFHLLCLNCWRVPASPALALKPGHTSSRSPDVQTVKVNGDDKQICCGAGETGYAKTDGTLACCGQGEAAVVVEQGLQAHFSLQDETIFIVYGAPW